MKKKKSTSPTVALARVRNSMKKAKEQKTEVEHQAVGKAVMATASFATGYLEQKLPIEVVGIPTKLIAAGVGFLAAFMTKGFLSKAAEGFGDAEMVIYGYKQGVQRQAGNQSLVAGTGNEISWMVEK